MTSEQRESRREEVKVNIGRDLHYMSFHTVGTVRRTQNVDKSSSLGNASVCTNSELTYLP
jgi:hypothetical protein